MKIKNKNIKQNNTTKKQSEDKKKQFFSEINEKFRKEILAEIKKAEKNNKSKIVIACHKGPDDDAIGSLLGTYYCITKYLGVSEKKLQMMISGQRRERWNYFKNYDKINFVEDIAMHLKDTDLLILLDGSAWHRFSFLPNSFKGKIICLDHHPLKEEEFDLHLISDKHSSTSQIIHDVFLFNKKADKTIAETLLMGIAGDTGNFTYLDKNNSSAFLVAEKLVREGDVRVEELFSKYNMMSKNVFKIFSDLMKNTEIKEIQGWLKFIFSTIDENYLKEYDQEDIQEAGHIYSGYLKAIEGVSWGFVITPRTRGASISLRSLPNSVSVRNVMERMKTGGGHDGAAGGMFMDKTVKQASEEIFTWMNNNQPNTRKNKKNT